METFESQEAKVTRRWMVRAEPRGRRHGQRRGDMKSLYRGDGP